MNLGYGSEYSYSHPVRLHNEMMISTYIWPNIEMNAYNSIHYNIQDTNLKHEPSKVKY